jgi:hypothetical protein
VARPNTCARSPRKALPRMREVPCNHRASLLRDFPREFPPLGKKPTIAILATARLMARITWQLLTQRRAYPSVVENQYLRSQPAERIAWVEAWPRKCRNRSKILPISPKEDFPQQNNTGWSRSQTLNICSSVCGDGSPLNNTIVTFWLPMPFSNSNYLRNPNTTRNHSALFFGLRTANPK